MKTQTKKEQKKYPYKKHRPLKEHSIFAQIRAREQRIKLKLPQYAVIDSKGNIIEKFRLRFTTSVYLKKLEKEKLQKLRICKLDEDGNAGVVISK